ncbi:MAG: tryptophan synthase subunit alpha [Acidimicrobiales bacterium]
MLPGTDQGTGARAHSMEKAFGARLGSGGKLVIPYVMAGATRDWVTVLEALCDGGADAIEVGLPFSDPMMDGPVIQAAGEAALSRGTTPAKVLDALGRAGLPVPIVVMTYFNLVLRHGLERFAGALLEAGVAGAIVPDLSLEELGPWAHAADAAGIDTVLMVAPATPRPRVAAICQRARGFVYAVARMGVTGERDALSPEALEVVGRARGATTLAVCAGIGISSGEHARHACAVADGVVVGSALVRRIMDGAGPRGAAEFLAELRAGAQGTP